MSLAVIVVILVVTIAASLIKARSDPTRKAHPGSLRTRAGTNPRRAPRSAPPERPSLPAEG